MCELLHNEGYEVHGLIRKPLSDNSLRIKAYLQSKRIKPNLYYCDLYQYDDTVKIIDEVKPDEFYHLAASHFSSQTSSINREQSLYKVNVLATFNTLSAIKEVSKESRVVTAGSCLMFDASDNSPQNEKTSFKTKSFYGLAKVTENILVKFFREQGLHISMAILYNHESPRRSKNFVTKKIVQNMVLLFKGEIKSFELGNIDIVKDWGYAKDYVYGMWLMAQQPKPHDYILASGKGHKIRDFIDHAAEILNISNWGPFITLKPNIITRNLNIDLIGDPTLAFQKLKWNHTINFYQLIELMVKNELNNSLD